MKITILIGLILERGLFLRQATKSQFGAEAEETRLPASDKLRLSGWNPMTSLTEDA